MVEEQRLVAAAVVEQKSVAVGRQASGPESVGELVAPRMACTADMAGIASIASTVVETFAKPGTGELTRRTNTSAVVAAAAAGYRSCFALAEIRI